MWSGNQNSICEHRQFSLVGQNFSWIEQVGHRLDRQRVRRQRAGTSETKTEVFASASRSKAKAKPRRPSTTCSSSRTVPILERTWIDIEPGAQFDQAYQAAKRLNTLLRVDRYTSHVFPHAPCTCDHTHIVAQGVSVRISLHLHANQHVSVRLLFLRVCLSPVSLLFLPFLSHCLLVLCLAHQIPCGRNRRGIKPLHSRTMRSIAPWRYTIVPQVMCPTSSTTSTTQRLLR